MSFEDNIRKWVQKDNQIKLYLEKIRNLRSERTDIATELLTYTTNNELDGATIQISDGKLRFQETKITTPLTLKFITRCLTECIENKEQVELIMQYIKEQRPTRYTKDIKRIYSNTN